MPQKELYSDASRFISSLVKSLQIICNGHINFNESIELVGHINLRVDHKFKYDYIVDELVSKEGQDSSVFLSNSYHSSPPHREKMLKVDSVAEDDLSLQTDEYEQHVSVPENITEGEKQKELSFSYGVNVGSAKEHDKQKDKMVFKLEEGDESNECMIIPSTSGGYEPSKDSNVGEIIDSGSDVLAEDIHSKLRAQKRHNTSELDLERAEKIKVASPMSIFRGKPAFPIHVSQESCSLGTGSSAPASYCCPECNFLSPNQRSHNLHVQNCQRLLRKHLCSICSFQCYSEDELRFHFDAFHKKIGVASLDSDEKKLRCSLCEAVFKSQTGLRQHMEVKHSANPSLRCPICGKIMYNKNNLEGHMNQHKGLKPFSCSVCKKAFAYKQSLQTHEKMCFSYS